MILKAVVELVITFMNSNMEYVGKRDKIFCQKMLSRDGPGLKKKKKPAVLGFQKLSNITLMNMNDT